MDFNIDELLKLATEYQELSRRLRALKDDPAVVVGRPDSESGRFTIEGVLKERVINMINLELTNALGDVLRDMKAISIPDSPYQ